jgi:hypothetical protein
MKSRNISGAVVLALGGALAFGQAVAAPSFQFTTGTTTVDIGLQMQATLDSQGITVANVLPASFDPAGDTGEAVFPMAAGDLDTEGPGGGGQPVLVEILHQGGLTLTAGGTRVALTSFALGNLGSDSIISAVMKVEDSIVGRVRLFTVRMTQDPVVVPPSGTTAGRVRFSDVELRLSQSAATALNAAFGLTNIFDGGSLFGNAEIFGRIRNNDGN